MFSLTQKGEADLKISVHDVADGMNVNEDLVILDFDMSGIEGTEYEAL